ALTDGGWRPIESGALWAGVAIVVAVTAFSFRSRIARTMWKLFEARTRYLHAALAGWLAVYILLLSHLVRRSMLNSATIGDVYIGLLLGLVFALAAERTAAPLRTAAGKALLFLVTAVFFFGLFLAWSRKVNESVDGSSFGPTAQIKGLEGLRWGNPTIIREGERPKSESGTNVTLSELSELVQFLEQDERNFFVFPDFSFLY